MFDGYNIEIVSGINLLKRVFGNAYDLYLENFEKYVKKQLSPQLAGNTQQDDRTPSQMLATPLDLRSQGLCPPNINYNNHIQTASTSCAPVLSTSYTQINPNNYATINQ